MHRIDGPGATAEEQFTQGDPAQAIPATVVTDEWLNAVQEELANVVESTGETLDKAENDQLLLAIQQIIADSASPGIPLGQPFWHLGGSPPDGCLEFAGQLLSRTTYSELWDALNESGRNISFISDGSWSSYVGRWSTGDGSTTFRAPKVLGNFLRVYDSGGATDPGRNLGTLQSDAFKAHSHDIYALTSRQDTWNEKLNTSGAKVSGEDTGSGTWYPGKIESTGGSETRPKNIAWMLCFRYQ